MEIKQLIPAEGWYVIHRDFQSDGLSDRDRVWSYPLCAFALVDEDGESRIEAVEVLGNEATLIRDGVDAGEYWELVRGADALEREIDKHYTIWHKKPWLKRGA